MKAHIKIRRCEMRRILTDEEINQIFIERGVTPERIANEIFQFACSLDYASSNYSKNNEINVKRKISQIKKMLK
jgi:hypothetical protein